MTGRPVTWLAAAVVLAGGCAYDGEDEAVRNPAPRAVSSAPAPSASAEEVTRRDVPAASAAPATTSSSRPATVDPMARARLSIPSIGVRDLVVVPYRGTPDDGPGTRIQNRGPAASPRGPGGGEAPGEIGNYIVTAHRTSAAAPFRDLPAVAVGDRVRVVVQGAAFVYEITDTRRTSFRSARSLARQAAAVPGRPGATATEAMVTLSTCATPEDRAAGNYWSDRFGNPEHRIDKVGVLVATRPA